MAYGPAFVGSTPYTLPAATASTLGGIKAGKNITVAADGTASAPDPYTLTSEKIIAALGFTPASAASTAQLPYSITYEGSYVGTAVGDSIYNANNPNYATEANPVKTTLSREYDVVVFLDACAKGQWVSNYDETCPEKYAFLRLMNAEDKFTESYIVMSALTSEWVRGLSGYQNSNHVKYGPVIQYEESPKKSIMYRKNGTTIERCWTRELISKDNTLGKPGSAGYIDKGAYMLLDRTNITYHVFGIDIDHRLFATAHAAEEGGEVV